MLARESGLPCMVWVKRTRSRGVPRAFGQIALRSESRSADPRPDPQIRGQIAFYSGFPGFCYVLLRFATFCYVFATHFAFLKMQIFVIFPHPLNGAGHTGPGLRPDFWQVEKHDVKASAVPSLKCSLCAEVLSAVQPRCSTCAFRAKNRENGLRTPARMASAV